MAYTADSPVSEAIFALLQDETLQSTVGGRLYGDIPEDTPRPCVLYEVQAEVDARGLGMGGLPELTLRTHVYSDAGSLAEAQDINRQLVALLKDAAVTVDGYVQCGLICYEGTLAFPDEELNGVKVHELVSTFTLWVEEVL